MFIYTIVNIGSEKYLKEEIALKYPELSFAYSRPGYITFKDNSGKLNIDSRLNLVFARAYGISLGRTKPENLELEVSKHRADVTHRFSLISDEKSGETANLGDTILDVVEVKEGEFWLGIRKVYPESWRVVGANPNLIQPEAAPSRAYLKIAEALIWTNYEYRGEESVLELGSAPGGASYAMVERGFKVFGVDNALMDADLLKNPNFKHIKEPMQKVQDVDVPRPCHLLVSDVNVFPSLVLGQLKRFMSIRPGIHTVFYTLEIGDRISIEEVLEHIDTFKTFGFKDVRATQLPSNKSEVILYGKK
ncbi:SAM-dependent methyltransferase [Cetobacterium sp.]|uniref:SAM-dependent methyltransferase n=2 Tax=Cetobacterium sp. TaxID=2071632 RepID=UPI003F2FA7B5